MEWWQFILLGLGLSLLAVLVAGFVLWRKASARTRRFAARVQELSWQERSRLMGRLVLDERLSPLARLVLPGLLLYLSLPIDLLPDFIPVVGQLDDALAFAVGVGLMRGSLAWQVLESHLVVLEAARNANGQNEDSHRVRSLGSPPPT